MLKRLGQRVTKFNDIDNTFKQLARTSDQVKIGKLLQCIDDKPELQSVLSKFLNDLDAIGINQNLHHRIDSKYKYYFGMLKYRQLHGVFWELCNVHDISQHDHKLRFNYENIGLLDPKNFTSEDYERILRVKNYK